MEEPKFPEKWLTMDRQLNGSSQNEAPDHRIHARGHRAALVRQPHGAAQWAALNSEEAMSDQRGNIILAERRMMANRN